MLRKFLKCTGIVLLIALLLAGSFAGWWRYQRVKYSSTAVPYVMRTLPEIVRWDPEVAKKFMASAAFKDTSDAEFAKLFDWLKKLGGLKKLGDPELVNIFAGVTPSVGFSKVLTYRIRAEFESGDALITLRLLEVGEDFQVLYFHVSSKALIG